MAVLPPHVDPCKDQLDKGDPECTGGVFDVLVETDGCTRAYLCSICSTPDDETLLADLIDGAEP